MYRLGNHRGRTSCAVEDKTYGTVSDGCSGTLVCGPACSAQPLFTAAENGARYQLREVCTGTRSDRVGTAGTCCRQDTYVTETICATALTSSPAHAARTRITAMPLMRQSSS